MKVGTTGQSEREQFRAGFRGDGQRSRSGHDLCSPDPGDRGGNGCLAPPLCCTTAGARVRRGNSVGVSVDSVVTVTVAPASDGSSGAAQSLPGLPERNHEHRCYLVGEPGGRRAAAAGVTSPPALTRRSATVAHLPTRATRAAGGLHRVRSRSDTVTSPLPVPAVVVR